LSISV